MKFLSFLFAFVLLHIAAQSQRTIDVSSYVFDIELSDKSDSISGKATIWFTCLSDTQIVSFDLRQAARKIGFTVSSVLSENKSLLFEQKNDRVLVDLGGSGKKNKSFHILIKYAGLPVDGLIISKNKFGKRTFFSDNWPNRAHEWIPCVDDPADKAAVEFIVTAPDHYQVVSNGIMIKQENLGGGRKKTYYKEEIPLPTKIMVIGVADFAVQQSGMVGSVPISSWVFPENKTEGFRDYGIAPPIVQWLSNYIGPFPFKKLANVQSKTIFGGMENASAIFYYENSVNGKADNESLIAHETAHQYFGDMVTETDFSQAWLSEGFATYMTHLFIGSKYGSDSLNQAMAKDRKDIIAFSRSNKLTVIDTVSKMMELLNVNSYKKGSWILHMLHRQVGDSLFQKGIREYYRTYAGKNATSKDLQQVFEKIIGKPLDTFFHQWLRLPGQPDLGLKWTYNKEAVSLQIDVKQLQVNLFVVALEIGIKTTDGKTQVIKLDLSQRDQTFRIPVTSEPTGIQVDPDVSLLFSYTLVH
ncbi:MAG: M1 family aminopeptidase [Chitinophagaceae bacterium]